MLPTVVQFGAGAIGRGFVGQLWTEAGFEVVFVDVDPVLIGRLNNRRSYPLRLTDFTGGVRDRSIGPVRAVDGRDMDAVASELARCAFAVTAVGVNIFSHLAPTIAGGIESRFRAGNRSPLNVICCENQVHAERCFAQWSGPALRRAMTSSRISKAKWLSSMRRWDVWFHRRRRRFCRRIPCFSLPSPTRHFR